MAGSVGGGAVQKAGQDIDVISGIDHRFEPADGGMRQRKLPVDHPGDQDRSALRRHVERLECEVADGLVTGEPEDVLRIEQKHTREIAGFEFRLYQLQTCRIGALREGEYLGAQASFGF